MAFGTLSTVAVTQFEPTLNKIKQKD